MIIFSTYPHAVMKLYVLCELKFYVWTDWWFVPIAKNIHLVNYLVFMYGTSEIKVKTTLCRVPQELWERPGPVTAGSG